MALLRNDTECTRRCVCGHLPKEHLLVDTLHYWESWESYPYEPLWLVGLGPCEQCSVCRQYDAEEYVAPIG